MFVLFYHTELKQIMSRRNEAPPDNLPEILRRLEWKPDCIRTTATCTYGKINFENVEHAGGKKPAKVGYKLFLARNRQRLVTSHSWKKNGKGRLQVIPGKKPAKDGYSHF